MSHHPIGVAAGSKPLRALAKASGGIVSIDAEGWRAETKAQALDRLRQNYRAASS